MASCISIATFVLIVRNSNYTLFSFQKVTKLQKKFYSHQYHRKLLLDYNILKYFLFDKQSDYQIKPREEITQAAQSVEK